MTTTLTSRSDRDAVLARDDAPDRDALIETHLGLADQVAGDYRNRGFDRDDLRQVARLGLVKAAARFDPTKGVRFGVFASVTINGELKRHFRDQAWSVRPPRSVQEAAITVLRARDALTQELGRTPTVDEIADRTGLDGGRVQVAIDAQGSFRAESLHPVDGARHNSHEPVVDDAGYEQVVDAIDFAAVAERLPDRDRRIFELRYRDGRNQAEIGEQVGLSQVQVSRLLRRIRERFAQQLADRRGELVLDG